MEDAMETTAAGSSPQPLESWDGVAWKMASRRDPSSRFPQGVTVSQRMGVVLAIAINTSALRAPADMVKEIAPAIIEAFLRIPPRESRNFWKWENSGERKLAIAFDSDCEMKEIADKLEASKLAYRRFYFVLGKRSRLSMISIFGIEEDIERVIGKWGSKWDNLNTSFDYSDSEGTDSEGEELRRNDHDYDMTFVINRSLGLTYLQLAEAVATAAIGLYRTINDGDREVNKHYVKWEDYEKIDDVFGAINHAEINVVLKECKFRQVQFFQTAVTRNGKQHTSVMGLFGKKGVLKSLLKRLEKL